VAFSCKGVTTIARLSMVYYKRRKLSPQNTGGDLAFREPDAHDRLKRVN